ncbi:MAG TPA: hypothetical protein QGF02_00730 [Candidatus Babeliales bacterium]|nr:hypothetical protein [Candidatus Babeliales bacterium]
MKKLLILSIALLSFNLAFGKQWVKDAVEEPASASTSVVATAPAPVAAPTPPSLAQGLYTAANNSLSRIVPNALSQQEEIGVLNEALSLLSQARRNAQPHEDALKREAARKHDRVSNRLNFLERLLSEETTEVAPNTGGRQADRVNRVLFPPNDGEH